MTFANTNTDRVIKEAKFIVCQMLNVAATCRKVREAVTGLDRALLNCAVSDSHACAASLMVTLFDVIELTPERLTELRTLRAEILAAGEVNEDRDTRTDETSVIDSTIAPFRLVLVGADD